MWFYIKYPTGEGREWAVTAETAVALKEGILNAAVKTLVFSGTRLERGEEVYIPKIHVQSYAFLSTEP
jgi:hypothetical protein